MSKSNFGLPNSETSPAKDSEQPTNSDTAENSVGPSLPDDELADDEIEGRRLAELMLKANRGELKARVKGVLDRGILHERLKVNLPSDLHGEWVRNDPLEIQRLRSLGFWVDNKYATNRALHNDGTSANIVGDTIFMVCTKELKEVIDEVQEEKVRRLHGKPGTNEQMKEEQDFTSETARGTGGIVPAFTESKTRQIDRAQVAAALERANSQTTPQGR